MCNLRAYINWTLIIIITLLCNSYLQFFLGKNNYRVLHNQTHHAYSSKMKAVMVSCQKSCDLIVLFSSCHRKKIIINK